MKRGLVVLEEWAPAELRSRVETLQRRLIEQGVEVAAIYGDVHRSGDITYLTNLCLYWNEGILLVPARGDPTFLTKLSPRVHPWMRATSTVTDLRSGPDLSRLVTERLGDLDPGALGIVDGHWWPAILLRSLPAALPGWQIRDLGPLVRGLRLRPSSSELAVLRESAAVATQAWRTGALPGLTPTERVAAAERSAREHGVEDVLARASAVWLEVVVEYRGYWTAVAGGLQVQASQAALAEAEARLRPGVSRRDLEAGGVTLLHHVDLETGGDHRPDEDRDAPLEEGAVVVLSAGRSGERLMHTYLITADGPERLTGTWEGA
ncbi:MAG TPA: aminopeptidase P family N-terminal domain-containing protein [Candidatus Dormibacteraeota bacterium]|nr:aminopeptidase P family N-terminal domain-containing protein [Candidatus Dormibacteraeota bacterium]